MFGVIVEVTLKTSENTCLEMDSMQLSCKRTSGVDNRSEFERIYHMTRVQKYVRQIDESDVNEEDEPGRVEIKLARLNILDLDMASFYVFRKGYTGATISTLPLKPRAWLFIGPRFGVRGRQAGQTRGLVLGCIDADVCK